MNGRAIRAIVRKDMRVVTQSKIVMLPLIVVPLIMLVILPGAFALLPNLLGGAQAFTNDPQMIEVLKSFSSQVGSELAGLNEAQQLLYMMLVYFFAPLYLIVPLMVSSVIAADSFAGEKERKTLEALIYTPTTDRELFAAKALSAWIPAMAVSLGGFVLYGLVANAAAWPTMGRIFFPNAMWIVLAFWVAPAVALVGLGSTVLISSRVATFQEAYQGGALIVLPFVALIVSQATGVLYLSLWLVLLLGVVLWGIGLALLWAGAKTFRRTEVIARL